MPLVGQVKVATAPGPTPAEHDAAVASAAAYVHAASPPHTRSTTGLPAAGGTLCDAAGTAHGYLGSLTTGSWGPRTFVSPVPYTDLAYYTRSDSRLTLTCGNGALLKCDRIFDPWRSPRSEDERGACVRMVRADYCGTGAPHTVDGVPIEVDWDAWDPAMLTDPDFEAVWTPRGAHCVAASKVLALIASGRRPGATSVSCPTVPFGTGGSWAPNPPPECSPSTAPASNWLWNQVY